MKKVLFLLFFIPSIAFGQIGIKAMSNLSWTKNSFSPRLTVSGGLFLLQNICPKFSLRQEALFTANGYSEKFLFAPEINTSGDTIRDLGLRVVDYHINNLEFPFLALLKFGDKVKPYIGGGSSLKFSVYSKRRVKLNNREYEFDPIQSTGFDINAIANAGVESKINNTSFHIEARFNYGLLKVINNRNFYSVNILLGIQI
jgi:hypothetical protein